METIKQKLTRILMEKGMSGTQANEVIDLAMPKMNNLVEDYSIDFSDSSDAYPDVLYRVLFVTIKPIALKWIEDNIPMAWFKPMFI